jgi:tetratricopeptide (TPR) repeat protein
MKCNRIKIIISIVVFSFSIVAFAQKEEVKQDEILFYEAIQPLNAIDEYNIVKRFNKTDSLLLTTTKQKLDKVSQESLKKLSQIIQNYPKSEYLFMALYEKGMLEFYTNDYTNAKITLIKVFELNTNYNQNSYRKEALKRLITISKSGKDYNQIINYLKLLNNKSLYTCGSDYENDQEYIKKMMELCNKEFEKQPRK